MNPIFPHIDDSIIYHKIDIKADIVRQISWLHFSSIWLQLFEYELSENQLVKFVELSRLRFDLFADESWDYCVSDHVDDIFAVIEAAESEIWLENWAEIVAF